MSGAMIEIIAPSSLATLGATGWEFTRPWMLWGLVALLPILWYYFVSLSDFPRWQRQVSLLLRGLVLLLLIASLAGLTLLFPSTKQFVVFCVDRSLSVDETAEAKIEQYLSNAKSIEGEDEYAILNLAATTSPVKREVSDLPEFDEEQLLSTNLAAAVETAAAGIPPGYIPKIVLMTDGRQTDGDVIQAAATSSVPISTVSLPIRSEPEVQVAEAVAPA
ncbi:MAG: hypothetical protein AAGG44_15200, partial [Planctomycetota bacterium]